MSPSLSPLQHRARDLSLDYLHKAGALYGVAFAVPAVRFDLKGTAAGQVRFDRGRVSIRYNPVLLEQYAEAFLQRTVPHEVAHLVAYQMYGRGIRPHGPQWKRIMRDFDAEPSRCHQFDTRGSRVRHFRQFTYHCACRTHALTAIRHNRVQRGVTYLCQRCKHPLRPAA